LAAVDPLPDASSGEPRPKAFDPASVLAAAATFLTLMLLAEGASRVAARTGFWYSRFDFGGTVTSLAELKDRVAWAASRERPVFLFGDSVLGATALLEHGASAPRRSALSAQVAEQERPHGRHVASLAADGMLLPDLEAEARLLTGLAAAGGAGDRRALVVLNFRMFASEFEEPSKGRAEAASRGFGAETSAGDRAVRYSALLRSSELLKSLWYFPTRRDFFRRAAERALGRDSDPEIQEAALRLKVAPYYRNRWRGDSPAFRALDGLLETLGPARVVLTPQNPDFVEDAEAFAANRALLASFMKAREVPGAEYRDWADRYPSERFLDHCHLTADGNRDYAAELARWIDR
jgi:hypothetical protein